MGKAKAPKPANALERIEDCGALIEHLGGISPTRIRLRPPPGRAKEKDLLRTLDRTNVPCELIDGVLVEKIMGAKEGGLGMWIGHLLLCHVAEADAGLCFGADSTMRLFPGRVRLPDVSFVSWAKLPDRCYPEEPIPDLAPDLAVEILNEGNTLGEMARKRRDYFAAGVLLYWQVDPATFTVTVYTSPEDHVVLGESDTLDGGAVLPGLRLPVARLFKDVRKTPRPRRKKKP